MQGIEAKSNIFCDVCKLYFPEWKNMPGWEQQVKMRRHLDKHREKQTKMLKQLNHVQQGWTARHANRRKNRPDLVPESTQILEKVAADIFNWEKVPRVATYHAPRRCFEGIQRIGPTAGG